MAGTFLSSMISDSFLKQFVFEFRDLPLFAQQAAAQSFPAVSARFIKLVVTQGHNAFAAIKHVTIQ